VKHLHKSVDPSMGSHLMHLAVVSLRPDGLEKVEGSRFVAKGVQQFDGCGFVRERSGICEEWVWLYFMGTMT